MFRLRRINALRWLWRIPVTVPVKSDPAGDTLYVDLLRNFRIVCSGVQAIESDERKSFDRLIDRFRPKVFWDVGSNVGIYALQFLARVPDGSVAAFEPDRRNIELLMRTVQKNNFKSITVVPRAVGESSGEAEFFLDDITGATGTINPAQLFIATQYGQIPNKTIVAVTTLDDELQARAGPDIIKIDVEGAELAAMTGGSAHVRAMQTRNSIRGKPPEFQPNPAIHGVAGLSVVRRHDPSAHRGPGQQRDCVA